MAYTPDFVKSVFRRRVSAELGRHIFLSYSGDEDRRLLRPLKRELERMPRPWYRPPSIRVFLDYSGISIGPDLWGKIVAGLRRSDWLVVVASKKARRSKWVDQEIEWWLANKSPDRILLLRSSGSLVWDDSARDWDERRSTALPPRLRGKFASEPVHKEVVWNIDARTGARIPDIERAALSINAVVSGKKEDDLQSEGLHQTRRNQRWAMVAVSMTTALALVATSAAIVAFVQRNHANQQTRIASARLMATTTDNRMSSDIRAAMLLAVAAYRTDPSPQNLSALMRANLAAPHLTRYLVADATVTELATSGNGDSVIAGLTDGRVLRWNLPDSNPVVVAKLSGEVSSVSVSHDGRVLAAADGKNAVLWRAGHEIVPLATPTGQSVTAVAVSPTGRIALIRGARAPHRDTGSLVVYNTETAETVGAYDDSFDNAVGTTHPILISDDEVMLYASTYGDWERRRLSDWSRLDGGSPALGTRQAPGEPAGNGGYTTASNGGTPIPVWSTSGPSLQDQPAMTAEAPEDYKPSKLALSNDGTAMAVGQDATIYLTPVAPPGTSRPAPTALSGLGVVSIMAFLGDSNRKVVAASRNLIAIWDIDQIDRLATKREIPSATECNACPPPNITMSPDGESAAIVAGLSQHLTTGTMLVPLDDTEGRIQVVVDLKGIPVWHPSGISMVTTDKGTWSRLPAGLRLLRVEGDSVIAAGPGVDRTTIVSVDGRGTITTQSAATGKVLSQVPGPWELSVGNASLDGAAVDPTGAIVATLNDGTVSLLNVADGKSIVTLGNDVVNVRFGGSRLVLQQRDGTLELWTQDGSRHVSSVAGEPLFLTSTSASAISTSFVVQGRLDGRVSLFTPDGDQLAVLDAVHFGSVAGGKTGLALAPDGHRLITVTEGPYQGTGTLIERDISVDNLISIACERAGRDLTADEWGQLIGIDRDPNARCP